MISGAQLVYAILNQTVSPLDLTIFQESNNLPIFPLLDIIPPNRANDNACEYNNGELCIEANLDVQMISGIAPGIPTTFYYWDETDLWLSFLYSLSSVTNNNVISISYASYEEDFTSSYFRAFNVEMIKLSLRV